MTRKQRRLITIGSVGAVLVLAVGLILAALNDQIVFFQGPTDIVEKDLPLGQRMRLGGLVEEGSLERFEDSRVAFKVTDGANTVAVTYQGILPDLFREGQGVIAEGELIGARAFNADTILAKHDENYMPKEVAETLKKQGVWKGNE
ncbi:MAG: cytochrome c maturation protein CcmE [Rhodobacteraceae bacterium]|nr:cytochrome c maturation protein CcmE [Paracoccaceae bacterium]